MDSTKKAMPLPKVAKSASTERSSIELETERVTAKTKLAQAKAALRQAEHSQAMAGLPAPEMQTEASNSLEVDDEQRWMAVLAAYEALRESAVAIGRDINEALDGCDKQTTKILLVDRLDYAGPDIERLAIAEQLKQFCALITEQREANANTVAPEPVAEAPVEDTSNVIPEGFVDSAMTSASQPKPKAGWAPPMTALGAVHSFLDVGAKISSYFRADYKMRAQDIQLDDEAAGLLVAGAIKWPTHVENFFRIAGAPLLAKMTAAQKQRAGLASDILRLQKQVAAVGNATTPDAIKQKTVLEATLAQAETLLQAFDAFVTAVMTKEADEKGSPLDRAVLREHLDTLAITHLLYVKVTSAGGEAVHSEKRLLGSPYTDYLGGGVITYAVATKDGAIVAAGTRTVVRHIRHTLGRWTGKVEDLGNPLKG